MTSRIAVVGIVGLPANYGGFETLVENLVRGNGERFEVYCSSKNYLTKLDFLNSVRLRYVNLKANGSQSILYDMVSITQSVMRGNEKILLLGVSGALLIPFIKIFFPRVQFFTNIDGLEWKRDKWGIFAKKFLKLSEKIAVKFSHKVICDNAAITSYVKKEYGVVAHTIAYGGDHAIEINFSISDDNYGLSVCRIEPENNVALILESFAKSGGNLIFIGNWESSNYGKNLKKIYSKYKNIKIYDPIYDPIKLGELRSRCSFYIHGHSAGGTNPSLVEIMHFPKPIVAFDCEYNRETLINQGVYFKSIDDLERILKLKKWVNQDTREIKNIAKNSYTWDVVRDKYMSLLDV